MQSLKPHTALLVVCLLGQKLGDNVVSLSQLNAVSTLFLMGKFFIKPFFTKTQGCFLQYPCYLRSGAKSEASLALLTCVLRPPLGRCLTQQSTSFFFLRMWRWGSKFKVAVSFPCELPVSVWRRWLETGFCWIPGSDLLARKGKTHESLFSWYTRHWPEVLVTVL